ncbi:ATPase, F1 complex, delta/epsilon subunit [Purpureocillium lavendulum]|uniref:ATPase, F1 complex, delta/epsilon subunit n=1 Tax=Purpureocillium lavendulum TaxID=1247861 RepID=A0AB34G6F4_9HYPO|nr:ATPase, F1 complex, delta/epsilon subunit [Purpureocillium lavendulum]
MVSKGWGTEPPQNSKKGSRKLIIADVDGRLGEVSDENLQQLARVLFHDSSLNSREWDRSQRSVLGRLDRQLRRPRELIPRLAVGTAKLGFPFCPPRADLCQTHKVLDPRIVRKLTMMVVDECTRQADKIRHGGAWFGLVAPLQRWLDRMDRRASLWSHQTLFTELSRKDFPTPMGSNGNHPGCEACLLALVGGSTQAISDLLVGVKARQWDRIDRGGRHPPPRLVRVLKAWMRLYSAAEEWDIMVESESLAKHAFKLRRDVRIQRERHLAATTCRRLLRAAGAESHEAWLWGREIIIDRTQGATSTMPPFEGGNSPRHRRQRGSRDDGSLRNESGSKSNDQKSPPTRGGPQPQRGPTGKTGTSRNKRTEDWVDGQNLPPSGGKGGSGGRGPVNDASRPGTAASGVSTTGAVNGSPYGTSSAAPASSPPRESNTPYVNPASRRRQNQRHPPPQKRRESKRRPWSRFPGTDQRQGGYWRGPRRVRTVSESSLCADDDDADIFGFRGYGPYGGGPFSPFGARVPGAGGNRRAAAGDASSGFDGTDTATRAASSEANDAGDEASTARHGGVGHRGGRGPGAPSENDGPDALLNALLMRLFGTGVPSGRGRPRRIEDGG